MNTKYRIKPQHVEAFLAFVDDDPRPQWFVDAINDGRIWYQGGADPYYTIVPIDKGPYQSAKPGDWIVKFLDGNIVVRTAMEFENQFEEVTPPPPGTTLNFVETKSPLSPNTKIWRASAIGCDFMISQSEDGKTFHATVMAIVGRSNVGPGEFASLSDAILACQEFYIGRR